MMRVPAQCILHKAVPWYDCGSYKVNTTVPGTAVYYWYMSNRYSEHTTVPVRRKNGISKHGLSPGHGRLVRRRNGAATDL